MIIKIYPLELKPIQEFLFELKLPTKISRARTNFLNQLQRKGTEIEESRKEIINQFADKDEEGQVIIKDGAFQFDQEGSNREQFQAESKILLDEIVSINLSEYEEACAILLSYLENDCELELGGNDAIIFDRICELLEGGN